MVDLRHHVRHRHKDHRELIATLPHTVSTVLPAGAPIREPDEPLAAWQERVTTDFLERKNAALAHYHGED